MKRLLPLATILLATAASAAVQPMLYEPSLSPDATEIAFVSGDDIWTVPAAGGEARILVAHPAAESRPLYSPDGKALAFVSNRTGNGDIYVVDLATGSTRRLTYDDSRDLLDSWSRDGKWIYFSSTAREADTGAPDIWRIPSEGGTPTQVEAEKMSYEYHSAPSPDGKSLAFVARGFASGQWWRHGRSHMDESQIYVVDQARNHRPVTSDGAKELWPMWSPDGSQLYYVSDRSGHENIWKIAGTSQPQQVTKFTGGRVLWPSIASNGKAIAFERDFGLWLLDTATGRAAAVPVTLRGVASSPAIERRRLTDRFGGLALSPDGKKIAFIARGELFAAPSKDPGDAVRVTNTAALESQPVWTTDSRSLVYVSDRDGNPNLFQYDFATEKEKQLTSGPHTDISPIISPNGKLLAFVRDRRELLVLDLGNGLTRTVARGYFDRPPFVSDRAFDFSPDSKWLAYLSWGENRFRNAFVVSLDGGEPRAVSFIANTNADSLWWSRDGKSLLMLTGQRTEPTQIARVDLVPITPKLREEQFRELFRETRPDTPKPEPEQKPENVDAATADKLKAEPKSDKKIPAVQLELAGIRDRIRLLPIAFDVEELTISPDGKWIAFAATVGDDTNVYVYSIDELATEPAVPKQLSSTSGSKSRLQFSTDSKEVWFLDGGKISAATIDPIKVRTVTVSAELDVDFTREKEEAFTQAWTYLRDNFFDEKMNGVDWAAARKTFGERAASARNGDEFRRILQLMVGELNASHLGAGAPADSARQTTGTIGVRFDANEYGSRRALKIAEVVPLSPADVAKIRVGEYIVSVDGTPVGSTTNFDALMEHKIGKRTTIGVAASPEAARRDVVLKPVNSAQDRILTYRAWVNANRDYVNRISNGRLGYVHMYDMGSASLQKLYLDLDAENRAHEGVIIDLRNNHGGFVNAYAIDVFARRGYMTMVSRDFPPGSARTLLGQRSLEKPTVLLINRHSLSDAEDFTEGYRSLQLGKVVGEPTAGWIVYTSNYTLIDGTSLRLPSTRILDAQGKDMEMNPRPVDRLVIRPVGESYAGKDSQLDASVSELLQQLKR